MRKLVIAESGEYEQRYTDFVASSAEVALRYLRETAPGKDWVLVDYMKVSDHPEPGMRFTPYRVWFIAPKGDENAPDKCDLSEVDFVE